MVMRVYSEAGHTRTAGDLCRRLCQPWHQA